MEVESEKNGNFCKLYNVYLYSRRKKTPLHVQTWFRYEGKKSSIKIQQMATNNVKLCNVCSLSSECVCTSVSYISVFDFAFSISFTNEIEYLARIGIDVLQSLCRWIHTYSVSVSLPFSENSIKMSPNEKKEPEDEYKKN